MTKTTFSIKLRVTFILLVLTSIVSCKKEELRFKDSFDSSYYESIRWRSAWGTNIYHTNDSDHLTVSSLGHSNSLNGLPRETFAMFYSYGFEDFGNRQQVTDGELTKIDGDFVCSFTLNDFVVTQGNCTFFLSFQDDDDIFYRPDSNELNGLSTKFGFFIKNVESTLYQVGYFTQDGSNIGAKNQFHNLFTVPYDKVNTVQTDGKSSVPFTLGVERIGNDIAFKIVDIENKLHEGYFYTESKSYSICFGSLLDEDVSGENVNHSYKIWDWSLETDDRIITDDFQTNSVYE